jgi:hypothetical protein
MKMSVEYWWSGIERGKLKCFGKVLCQCHFVHHRSELSGVLEGGASGGHQSPNNGAACLKTHINLITLY